MKALYIKEEVRKALGEGTPVVALESTIITHGMPHPANIDMALNTEGIIREAGAVPATIAVVDGDVRVGLDRASLETLAKSDGVHKASTRDLSYMRILKRHAGTTVAATMHIARAAGIDVFATGGIGGVHRGASESFDVSADLETLADTSVCVVCAGAKAILDLPSTMEVLETQGVEVIGYRTDELPAFYSRESGIETPVRLDDSKDVAALFQSKRALGLKSGIVVANPIPHEHALPASTIEQIIEVALKEASQKGIKGKEVTPFLLSRIESATGGDSLRANLELVYNNAALAAKIAKALIERERMHNARS